MFQKASLAIRRTKITRLERTVNRKSFSASKRIYQKVELSNEEKELLNGPRDVDETDVVIVGAGPSGLSAAIRLKQLAQQHGVDFRVTVVEKAAEVGAHILSGAVIQPTALNELFPDWKERGAPLNTPVTKDKFYFLTEKQSIRLPTPRYMHNDGNYVISLANLVRWLGKQAEDLGVEIYPGIAASEVLYSEKGSVQGVATGDVGIGKDGHPTEQFARGMELRSRFTLFGEGARGSLTKTLFKRFGLNAECDPQVFGLGMKELWEIPAEQHQPGLVVHTVGWPVKQDVWGGAFVYHLENNQVFVGYVVGLDYKNPYITPYKEFQRFKHHPLIAKMLEGGKCIQYGARAINEGGYQSIPKLNFPGGALIGCTAGFLNVPKIKGIHNAMKSGMVAAESLFDEIRSDAPSKPIISIPTTQGSDQATDGINLTSYPEKLKNSWVYKDLYEVRNIQPSFQHGLYAGMAYSAVDTYVFQGKAPWTFRHHAADHARLRPASEFQPIDYPKPDGRLSFDLLTNLSRSGTNHNEDQPAHLKLRDPKVPIEINYPKYASPETRYCPAGVYELVEDSSNPVGLRLQINAQNCLHCKTCDIKDPTQNIDYTTPEGGGGPAYGTM